MARLFYGGSGADVIARRVDVDDDTLQLALNITYDVYTARTGGSHVTDLLDAAGAAITEVTPDESGVRFQGPDGATAGLWLQNQDEPTEARWLVNAADQDIRPEFEGYVASAKTYDRVPQFVPSDYGAVGNGATDDTAFWVDLLDEAAGGTVVCDRGATYLISDALDPAGAMIIGNGATFKHKGGVTAFNMFDTTEPFEGYNFDINMNEANVSSPGGTYIDIQHMGIYVRATGGYDGAARFHRVNVKNAHGPGIRVGSVASETADPFDAPAQRSDITACTFDNTKYGTVTVGCTDSTTARNVATDILTDGFYDIDGARNSSIGDKVYGAGRHGILFEYTRQFSCSGGIVRDAASIGFVAGGGDPARHGCDLFTFAGNTAENCNIGYQLDATKSDALTTEVELHATVSGNVASNCTVHGIYLQQAAYVSVNGNTAVNNGNAGIAVVGRNCTIGGNTCTGNDSNIALWGHEVTKGDHVVGHNNLSNPGTNNFVGDTEAKRNLNIELPWQSYSAVIGGGTANIGNGTIAASYTRSGKTIHFKIKITRGTTTTFGSTNLLVSLPLAATSADAISGVWRSLRTGTAFYHGFFYANAATTVLFEFTDATARGATVNDTAPYTWVTGDWLELSGTYEVA